MNMKVTPLLGLLALGLAGCLPEDEPNNDPTVAFNNYGYRVQYWEGDDNLPGPNGRGVLEGTPGSGSSWDRDCWPIHMYIPHRGPSNVTEFAGYIWLEPGCEVSVGLMGYVGPDEDGVHIWDWIDPLQPHSCNGDQVICASEISLQVDVIYNDVAVVIEGTGNYGFFLSPLID